MRTALFVKGISAVMLGLIVSTSEGFRSSPVHPNAIGSPTSLVDIHHVGLITNTLSCTPPASTLYVAPACLFTDAHDLTPLNTDDGIGLDPNETAYPYYDSDSDESTPTTTHSLYYIATTNTWVLTYYEVPYGSGSYVKYIKTGHNPVGNYDIDESYNFDPEDVIMATPLQVYVGDGTER